MSTDNPIPTMVWYLDNEWDEGDGLPGPSYRRKYGVDPGGPEAMGETQQQWDIRMERNGLRVKLGTAESLVRDLARALHGAADALARAKWAHDADDAYAAYYRIPKELK